jgi:septal ring factor EnvC (AmiA/AmiB activator)
MWLKTIPDWLRIVFPHYFLNPALRWVLTFYLTTQCALIGANDDTELAKIRTELVTASDALAADAGQLSTAREHSFKLERDITEAQEKQLALDRSIAKKRTVIKKLRASRVTLEKDLAVARRLLQRNTIARYALARQPRLKLLLNQQAASSISRGMAYYDYAKRAYAQDLSVIRHQLEAVRSTESALKLESNALRRLTFENEAQLAALKMLRDEHRILVSAVEKRMAVGTNRVEQLRIDEQRLIELVARVATTIVAPPVSASFASRKGKLTWPASGRLASTPGKALRVGGARWAGVFIDSPPGDAVNTVAEGQVVFADWFRNLGKLLIVDHGDGYMSLYGNNAEVHKKPGDSVEAGDIIATVGSGTGEMPAGVYFELRERGEPIDPRLWCDRR